MTLSLRVSLCLLALTIGSFAQSADTYDLATFSPPVGWTKVVTQNKVQLSTVDKESA